MPWVFPVLLLLSEYHKTLPMIPDKSTLVQATSHYLSQCWPWTLSPCVMADTLLYRCWKKKKAPAPTFKVKKIKLQPLQCFWCWEWIKFEEHGPIPCVASHHRLGCLYDDVIKWKLALWEGNSPVTGEFPSQRPVTRSFDVLFDLRLNKRLNKQSIRRWCGNPSRPFWRHCNIEQTYCWLPIRLHPIVENYRKWKYGFMFPRIKISLALCSSFGKLTLCLPSILEQIRPWNVLNHFCFWQATSSDCDHNVIESWFTINWAEIIYMYISHHLRSNRLSYPAIFSLHLQIISSSPSRFIVQQSGKVKNGNLERDTHWLGP